MNGVFPAHRSSMDVCSRTFLSCNTIEYLEGLMSTQPNSTGWRVLSPQGMCDQSVGIIDVPSEKSYGHAPVD